MPVVPLYFDRYGNPTNRVPDGYEAGWRLNTNPPVFPS